MKGHVPLDNKNPSVAPIFLDIESVLSAYSIRAEQVIFLLSFVIT